MPGVEAFRNIALSLPGTIEQPHFDRAAFRVTGRRIFATLHEASKTANIKLTSEDQSFYCSTNKKAVYPVPNKFGLHGWTTFEIAKLSVDLITDAIYTAYKDVLTTKPKKK